MPTISQPELQLRTLHLYGELVCRASRWAHQLTFAAFEGAASSGLAAASSLAGAASLTVDADAALVKAHFRDGAFDFVVNTLDEALRAIKNEVRQGRPIAIALIGQPESTVEECRERGVALDFVLHSEDAPSDALQQWLKQRGWQPGKLNAELADDRHLSSDDHLRRAWLLHLPTYQRSVRQGARWGWVDSQAG